MAEWPTSVLGKYKSVACRLNTTDGGHSYRTIRTTPVSLLELLTEEEPDRIVIEIGAQAGWIADLSESLGIELQVANPQHDAWRWKNVRRKTDRDDALRLAQMSEMGTAATGKLRRASRLVKQVDSTLDSKAEQTPR